MSFCLTLVQYFFPLNCRARKAWRMNVSLGFPERRFQDGIWGAMLISVFKINTCGREKRKPEWAEWSNCDAGARTGLRSHKERWNWDGSSVSLQVELRRPCFILPHQSATDCEPQKKEAWRWVRWSSVVGLSQMELKAAEAESPNFLTVKWKGIWCACHSVHLTCKLLFPKCQAGWVS